MKTFTCKKPRECHQCRRTIETGERFGLSYPTTQWSHLDASNIAEGAYDINTCSDCIAINEAPDENLADL